MIRIGRMSMTLPHSLAGRANRIAHHVGEALAHSGAPARALDLPALGGVRAEITNGQSDADIGAAIASAIWARVRAEGER
jgi:hypothetical protein